MENGSKVCDNGSVVSLNVGGTVFMTTMATLQRYKESMLGAMFSGRHNINRDSEGRPFIDTSPLYFAHILDYLRLGTLPPLSTCQHKPTPQQQGTEPPIHGKVPGVVQETYDAWTMYSHALYFGITPLIEELRCLPHIAHRLVQEARRARLPNYDSVRRQVISTAVLKASESHDGIGVVTIRVTQHALPEQDCNIPSDSQSIYDERGRPLSGGFQSFFSGAGLMKAKSCLAKTADVVLGPWNDNEATAGEPSFFADGSIQTVNGEYSTTRGCGTVLEEEQRRIRRGLEYLRVLTCQLTEDGFISSRESSVKGSMEASCSRCRHVVISVPFYFDCV